MERTRVRAVNKIVAERLRSMKMAGNPVEIHDFAKS